MATFKDTSGQVQTWPDSAAPPAPPAHQPRNVTGHSTPEVPEQAMGVPPAPPVPVPSVTGEVGTIVSYQGHLIGRVDADGVVAIDPTLSETAAEALRLVRAGLLCSLSERGVLKP